MTDTILLVDQMGRILFLAADADSVLGTDLDHWIGASALDVVHPEDVPAVATRLGASIGNPDAAQQFIRIRIGTEGQWFPVELHGFNPLEFDGTPVALVSIRDTTGQLTFEQARSIAEESLSDTANPGSSVVHDLLSRAFFRTDAQVLVMHLRLTNYDQMIAAHGQELTRKALDAAAQRIRHASRDNDLVARIDQESLFVLCSDIAVAKDAHLLGRRVFDLAQQVEQSELSPCFALGFALASEGDDLAEVEAYIAENSQITN